MTEFGAAEGHDCAIAWLRARRVGTRIGYDRRALSVSHLFAACN
jgi:hypothetical protein